MSVRVQVTGQNKRAVVNAEVFVKWKNGGTSRERTNSSGVADLNCSGGTIEYITVWSERVLGAIAVGDNDIIEVTYTKA